ncbi:uncharacterized protein LOC111831457 [Capsella rubella]|uniref:uncharacterized protein LOC111831457 n=1 Tax=Capsella rubella TaxID=81985 RepID=UPI000CD4F406|nr:uncharacterized protein LOC111831457 [Capsella rubella]
MVFGHFVYSVGGFAQVYKCGIVASSFVFLETLMSRQMMEKMKEKLEKMKRTMQQHRAKLHIIRICITMLLSSDDDNS